MAAVDHVIAGALILLGLGTTFASRLPTLRNDFRRGIAVAVMALALLMVLLSVQVLLVGLKLRATATNAGAGELPELNGLVLGAIALLLVSALAFFLALGVFLWTTVQPGPPGSLAPSAQGMGPVRPNA